MTLHKHLILLMLFCSTVAAQSYPAKPIRFVVPFPPGGSNDVLSRAVALGLGTQLAQQVVIDNRPGAGAMIGAENVAKSPPDGYSILNVQGSFATNAAIRRKLPYDPITDFSFVGMMATGPMILIVHPALPVKSLKELLALAKTKPGEINYASTGSGGSNHLATELFRRLAGINIVHVPYKGAVPALTDLLGGHTQLFVTSLPSVLPQVQAGRLKALAVTGAQRNPFTPGIPTASEAGVPGYVVELWWGIAAPAKTPNDIVNRLAAELLKVLQLPDTKERFAREGAEPVPMSRDAFADFVSKDIARWKQVVRDAGLQQE
jgi:tripartite-type tricarboxylate transporter receptor subunit TctC